jgi:carboxypeptidase Taq
VVEQQSRRPQRISGTFPIEQQKLLNRELMIILGFNFSEGRVDESSHPFSTGVKGDHRITTRFRSADFIDALKATAHETGHASYESGLPSAWEELPVGQARNLCIHESQSLLFERQLFLAKPFINFFTQRIHAHLPDTTGYDCERIWQGCTMVAPSLIRVEADEVSYPLHVILRFEIEKELINGTLDASEVPDIWDEKMQHYLGLSTAGDYSNGCLQDIHWTDGSFGYFPAYTLGAVNGVQIFEAICQAYPGWQEQLFSGDVGFLRDWLSEHIWSKGSLLSSQQIMQGATGEGTNPAHFLRYISKRYLEEQF